MNDEMIKSAVEGEMVTKVLPDVRATAETMEFDKWYRFSKSHYLQWVMFSRSKTKTRYPYGVVVKQRNLKTYVRKYREVTNEA